MNGKNLDWGWIYTSAVVLLVVTGYITGDHLAPEWRGFQADFREMVTRRFGQARATQVPAGIQQVWVPQLGRADRCTTCHLGVSWRGFESAPEPFRTHSREILEKHPIAQYGCTVCHGGQGQATDERSAHATMVDHWDQPVLGAEFAKTYLVKNPEALLQINCNQCHRYDRETKGADYINYAKKLVQQKGCRACHTINDRGGVVGPNLTYIGDQSPEQYDYARLNGVKTVFAWHLAHFKEPKAMVSTTVMPNFGFGSKEAQSLAMLVLSWKKTDLPVQYIPGAQVRDVPTPEELAKEKQMETGEGAFFVKKTCFICHSVSTLGIESATNIGPDLANAAADVQARFGRTLDDFLAAPTGTMAVVLSTQIHLTSEERAEAIRKLKAAYQLKLDREKTARPKK
jgi:cytochrome c2